MEQLDRNKPMVNKVANVQKKSILIYLFSMQESKGGNWGERGRGKKKGGRERDVIALRIMHTVVQYDCMRCGSA